MTICKKTSVKKGTEEVHIFTLTNDQGMVVEVMNYGCTLMEIKVPDRNGKMENILLHYDRAEDYFKDSYYLNCIVGRYANRIANGSCSIGGKEYQLSVNEAALRNHLHGGFSGFNKKVWEIADDGSISGKLVFSCLSPHLEEGYPGNLRVEVSFYLGNDNALEIAYSAGTDQPTIVNLTHHSYFNLSGGSGDIFNHDMKVNASFYTPSDERYIPSGDLAPVAGTPYDLRETRKVETLVHTVATLNYCLDDHIRFPEAAQLSDPTSGRRMRLHTTEPGMQLYFGNFLGGEFAPFSALCMEPQHYPDSPNHPLFPSTILLPGEEYFQSTVYRFDTLPVHSAK